MINRRTLLASTAAGLVAAPFVARAQSQKVQVNFWHGLGQPLGGILEAVVAGFNGSPTSFQGNATFRGAYPQTMQAAIAPFPPRSAPPIVQLFAGRNPAVMRAPRATLPGHQLPT